MAAVGTVAIGGRRIALEAFTGEVVDTQRSSHTETTVDRDAHTQSTRTWHNKFLVRAAGGTEWSVEFEERVAAVKSGQQVTLLCGIVGRKESNWLAIFNHTTGRVAYVAQTRNDLAGPILYNMLMIIAVFVAVFSLFSLVGAFGESAISSLFWLLGSGAYFVWVVSRRKKLTEAVEEAVKRLKTQRLDAAAS